MPNIVTDRLGSVEIRDVDGVPSRIEGMAVPYGETISVYGGRERFRRGAFAEQVAAVRAGERLAYLTRHGENGGVLAASIDHLEERDAGLFFGASFLQV